MALLALLDRECVFHPGRITKHPLKILDVLFDIAYKPSIEGCSWCFGRASFSLLLQIPS
jgi:hypothetical protein